MKYINLNFNYKKAALKKTTALGCAIIIASSLVGCKNNDDVEIITPNNNVVITEPNEIQKPIEKPIIDEPVKQEPIKEEPVKQEPVTEEPIQNPIELQNVALTFDDGPSIYTNDLLDVLKENNIKATFFLTGENINKYPETVKRMYNEGHTIGIHGYSHTSFNKLGISGTINEINICKNILAELGVEWSGLVRPPYGSINEDIKENVDVPFILWSVDTRDWESRNTYRVIERFESDTFGGSIVLMHDLYPTTVEAMREILPDYKDKYNFVSVDTLYNNNLEKNKVYRKN